jgi:hypothetical protein
VGHLPIHVSDINRSWPTSLVLIFCVSDQCSDYWTPSAVGERRDVHKGFLFRGVLNDKPKATLIVPAFNAALQTHRGSRVLCTT